jgi:HK97 family phage portal protein
MAYWDNLINFSGYEAYVREKDRSAAFSAHYPLYEQTSPQYTAPSPYQLAQQGYRANALIYACIDKRMRAISAAPMRIYDISGAQPVVIRDSPALRVLHQPNERISERQFWQITSMYLDISGFSCWEIERNNGGDPIKLWPMRSDWCSFMRGNGRPLRVVRYQPYGLPYQDIPVENILLFQYFDPIFPLLKGYSPTMAALKDIAVDNGMAEFLFNFIKEGARYSGLLSTDQDLDDIEAERIKQRWKSQHGGVENWNDIAVIGRGTTYQNTSMNFNDMAFPELDGRTEARMCMAFQMPPILVGAKIGLRASTFTNYGQAREAWYEEWVSPQWEFLAEQYQTQMLRDYDAAGNVVNDPNIYCEFYTKKVRALQPNRDQSFKRAVLAAHANVFSRDQALEEIGSDPVDGKNVYVGATITLRESSSLVGESDITGLLGAIASPDEDLELRQAADKPIKSADQVLEERQFKAFAAKRIRENHPSEIDQFEWLHTPVEDQKILYDQFMVAVSE